MHENVSVGRGQVMALPDPNDLIQTAKKGKAGFANLYQAYALRVYRYIYARVGNHQDTEDLTSQVFIAVMNGIESFGGNHNLSAWIFTIARNKVADRYRKQKPEVALEQAYQLPSGHPDPLQHVLADEQVTQLLSLVSDLDAEKQELLQLRFAAELSYNEIGEVVGKSEGAVKMAVHRILHQLQEKMEHKDA